MNLRSIACAAALSIFSFAANATLDGDTATVTYGGWVYDGAAPGSASAVIGPGVEFSQTFADGFGQIWTVNADFTGNVLGLSWTESTRSDGSGNIQSATGLFTLNFSFLSSAIHNVTLASFTPTAYDWGPGSDWNQSHLGNIAVNDPNSFQLEFSQLRSGEQYVLNVNAVPEPETYAMMMAGLALLGVVTRRRKIAPQA